MKKWFILLFALTSVLGACTKGPQIVAHRGYWDLPGCSQNSIASLREAQRFGCWGSEFDLHLTADDVVVVNHDATIGETSIQDSPFSEVRAHTLSNGEPVSTLDEYLAQGETDRSCVLVLELKPHKTVERESLLIDLCLEALKAHGLYKPSRAVFISFSHYICQELVTRAPGFTVQYLEGDLSPEQLHAEGINGLDYHYSVFQKNPQWVEEAHALGMSVNVWTVNQEDLIREMIGLGVDQITTNDPALVRRLIKEQ